MRIVLMVIIALHGLIHLLGFLKGFNLYDPKELLLPISKGWGVLWLLAMVLLLAAAAGFGLRINTWWLLGVTGAVLSQILVINYWSDAKFGTLINILILILAIISFSAWSFKGKYTVDVREGLSRMNTLPIKLLTLVDIQHLPNPVQNYLHFVGAVGKPQVRNMRVSFTAEMRGQTQDWFSLDVEQFNFFDETERLFFLDARVKGLPTVGYHLYKDGKASMDIKLLSLIPVVDVKGKEMFEAETVTFFNDMCFLAPSTLIDKRIEWQPIDSSSVDARFTNQGVTISARLIFNEQGQLVNFISDDRYDVNEMKKYRFSTPLSEYREINGYRLANYGEAIWHYPEGKFVYGKYRLKNIEYNVRVLNAPS